MGFREDWAELTDGEDASLAISVAVRDIDGEVWVDGPDLVFPACSISKHVAAFGALRLVAEGRLDLDEDVNAYLSSWELPGSGRVTTRQLLAHTAGLTENWFPGYPSRQPVPSLRQVLDGEAPANSPAVRRELTPGEVFRYSGSHYTVLQQLLCDTTGRPFADLMLNLVLRPVGMVDSSFDQGYPLERRDRAAVGHSGGTPLPGGWHIQPELAAAGLWSTPADLVRFEAEVARAATGGSRLLPTELAVQMLDPAVPGGFGLGTEIGKGRHGHTGQNTGFCCFVFAWPATATTMAVMMNADDCQDALGRMVDLGDHHFG